MKRLPFAVSVLLIAAMFAVGCVPPPVVTPNQPVDSSQKPPEPAEPGEEPAAGSGEVQSGQAVVESVDVLILESFPVQVNAVVSGYLPDGCTTIDQVTTQQKGNEFDINITTQRPADQMCIEAIVPYSEVVSLPVAGLPAGAYTVTANGVSASFELDVDN